jgi:RNA polymerase sigma-70 factor (ECF subfamily)
LTFFCTFTTLFHGSPSLEYQNNSIVKIVSLQTNIQEIITKAIQQDRAAQKYLYERFSPKLLSICRQYVSQIDEAEDILVTAFMKIFKNLGNLENRDQLEGWMKRIAVNESISYIRTKKNMKIESIEDHDWSGHDHNMESNMAVQDIQGMIDRLPDGCKVVFNLYALEGYKHAEIATLLSISEGTSKSQLAYARKLLQDMIVEQQKFRIHG